MQYLQNPEEDVGSPRIGVKDRYKPAFGCWDSNPGPLKKKMVLNHFSNPVCCVACMPVCVYSMHIWTQMEAWI